MADASSQKAIWQVLDGIRGRVSADEYGLAIASLIYVRWLDFERIGREAVGLLNEFNQEPVLAAQYRWRSWCDIRDPRELQHVFRRLPSELNSFARSCRDPLATQLRCVANAVEKLSKAPAEVISQLTIWLAEQPFETSADLRALRDVLDSVLLKTYGKFTGHFFTPIEVAAMMVEIADPKIGESIYDPCFGYAGLLTATLDVVTHREEVATGKPDVGVDMGTLRLSGVEINSDAFVIGLTRLVLSGLNSPHIALGNSLEQINLGSGEFDVVLANPPWGMKVDIFEAANYRIPTRDSSSLFVQHALSQLRPGGRAVVVVPPSLLFRGGREQELRRWLLHEHSVEAIVSIPRGAFMPHTSIETCLLKVRRGGGTKSIRMVNTDSIFEKAAMSQIGSAPFVMAGQLGHHVRSQERGHEWWDVDVHDLVAIDYDLTPKRRDRSGLELILDSLSEQFEVKALKDVCEVMTGRSIQATDLTQSPPKSNFEPSGETLFPEVEREGINPQRPFAFADAPIPYIRIRDVSNGEATRGSSWLMPVVASTIEAKWKLRSGDVLLSKSGTIGKVGIVRNSAVGAIAANGFFVLRLTDRSVDPHYLLAYLQSAEATAWMEDRARGAAAKHLSVACIRDLPIALPPLELQRSAVDHHRKFGVDILTQLSELLSHDATDVLNSELTSWVSQNLNRVEAFEDDLGSQAVLDLLEVVSQSSCPVRNCKTCGRPYHLDYSTHYLNSPEEYWKGIGTTCLACWLGVGPGSDTIESLATQSPIAPWALDFSNAIEPLSTVSRIPEAAGVLSVLQSTEVRLSQTLQYLEGQLDNQERARRLTKRLINLIDSFTRHLVADITIVVNVLDAIENDDGEMQIRLTAMNRGHLPLRDATFTLKPPLPSTVPADIPYLSPGIAVELEFRGTSHWYSEDSLTALEWNSPEWSLSWKARTLTGEIINGKRELGIEFQQRPTLVEAAKEALGPSPYVTGDPVKADRNDVFFGREELIEQIRRQVSHSGNVVLLEGNRRAGKSSVLWHLEGANTVPGWLGVYCSMQGTESDSSGGIPTAEVFRGIAYEIVQSVRKLNGSAILPDGSLLDGDRRLGIARSLRQGISEQSPFQDFREYLELVLEMLAERQLGLLLMLDEFDKLQEGIDKGVTSPQVPENIRFLVQSYPKFSAILTGSRRLKRMREEYWSALFGLGTRLGVSALPLEAASRLVIEPVAGRLSFSKSAVNRAYELTAGQPYLLQCLCNRVFDIAARTGVRSITVDHVNDAASALVEDNEHFASLWDYTEFDRRRFLLYLLHREANGPDPMRLGVIEAKLEEAGVELREEIVISDLEYLRELELVDLHGESSGAYYTLTIPMMGQWLDSQQDYEVLRSRARAEAEDISGKLNEIVRLQGEIEELEDSMDTDDE